MSDKDENEVEPDEGSDGDAAVEPDSEGEVVAEGDSEAQAEEANEALEPPDEATLAELDAAEERLRELRDEKLSDNESPKRLIWVLPAVAVVFGLVIYIVPAWFTGETTESRLMQRSLAYCKYDGPKNCESDITQRTKYCLKHNDLSDRTDPFGRCMMERFPDYYLRIGQNLPK